MAGGNIVVPGEIRAVFFDAGDPLHRLDGSRSSILAAMLSEVGVELSPTALRALEETEALELDRIWDGCDLLYPDDERGLRYLSAEYCALLARLGIDGGAERAEAVARQLTRGVWRRVFPDTMP